MRAIQYFNVRERVTLLVRRGDYEFDASVTFAVTMASDGAREAEYLSHDISGLPAEDSELTEAELREAETRAIDKAINAQGGGYWS